MLRFEVGTRAMKGAEGLVRVLIFNETLVKNLLHYMSLG